MVLLGACTGNPVSGTVIRGDAGGEDGGSGGAPELPPNIVPPVPIMFRLTNDGPAAWYVHAECNLGWTFTELRNPTEAIGLPTGCGVCDCSVSSCPPVTCGPCHSGWIEVPAGSKQTWYWTPIDMSYETRGNTVCSHTRGLSAGQYRIDLPIYASMADAIAKVNGRVLTQEFSLPSVEPVVIPLAAASP